METPMCAPNLQHPKLPQQHANWAHRGVLLRGAIRCAHWTLNGAPRLCLKTQARKCVTQLTREGVPAIRAGGAEATPRRFRVAINRPPQRGSQIAMFAVNFFEPFDCPLAEQMRFGFFSEGEKISGVIAAHIFRLIARL